LGKRLFSLCLIIATVLALSFPLLAFAPPPSNPLVVGTPVASPVSPTSSDTIKVSVNVTQSHPGVMNVSIVYTTDNWQSVNVTRPASYNSTTRTWTASIPPLTSGGHVSFYVVAFDYNDNKAVNNNSGSYFGYDVAGAGLPGILANTSNWIIIAIILGAIGSFAIVLLRSGKARTSKPRTTS